MANNPKFSTEAVNVKADALCALLNSGKLRIYTGTQPATANTAIGAQVLLAELTLNATAFGAAVEGVATANAITADASADATGTATWFRTLKSDGTSGMWDGSAGTSGADLNLNAVALVEGAAISIASFTYQENKG